MHLLEQYMIEERGLLMRERIRLSMIGHRDALPASTLAELDRTVALCAANGNLNNPTCCAQAGRALCVEGGACP